MASNLTQIGQKVGSNIDPLQVLQALIKGTGFAGNAMSSMTPMSPMMQLPEALIKGANKALTKLGEQYAVEAANTPGGLQSLSQQLNQPKITMAEQQLSPEQLAASPTNQFAKDANKAQITELNSLLVPQGQAQAPQAMPQPQVSMAQPQSMSQNPLAILSQLGNMMHTPGSFNQQTGDVKNPTFFGMESEEANQRFLENQIRKQQLTGNVPLQKGEREKESMEIGKELAKQRLQSLQELSKRGTLTAKDLFDTVSNDPIIKDYNDSMSFMSQFNELMKDESGASDLAIIFNFMKALDPRSTVREGEQAQAKDVTGAGAKFLNIYNGVVKGRKLSRESRKQLLSAANQAFKGKKSVFDNKLKEFTAIGKQSGIEPEMFIPSVAKSKSITSGKVSSGLGYTVEA